MLHGIGWLLLAQPTRQLFLLTWSLHVPLRTSLAAIGLSCVALSSRSHGQLSNRVGRRSGSGCRVRVQDQGANCVPRFAFAHTH